MYEDEITARVTSQYVKQWKLPIKTPINGLILEIKADITAHAQKHINQANESISYDKTDNTGVTDKQNDAKAV